MLFFPESTHFNKRIPKQKFYEKLPIQAQLEKLFVSEIDTVYWRYKLSTDTINLDLGKDVLEIQIFEITLKSRSISRTVLETIDSHVPYHLVFVLKHENMGQLVIGYKEKQSKRNDRYTVHSYYETTWKSFADLSLSIDGLNLDRVYENFINQISGGLVRSESGIEIRDEVQKVKEDARRDAEIEALEKKIRNEKQFNRQVELKRELEMMKSSPPGPLS
jgi:hypothetical protein